jgi:hypothetical protein
VIIVLYLIIFIKFQCVDWMCWFRNNNIAWISFNVFSQTNSYEHWKHCKLIQNELASLKSFSFFYQIVWWQTYNVNHRQYLNINDKHLFSYERKCQHKFKKYNVNKHLFRRKFLYRKTSTWNIHRRIKFDWDFALCIHFDDVLNRAYNEQCFRNSQFVQQQIIYFWIF